MTPDDSNMIHANRKLLKLAFGVSMITLVISPPDRTKAGLYIMGSELG
jgi:hypothetical protein